MKVLKIIERVVFILAVVLAFVSISLSAALDELTSVPYPGVLTGLTTYFAFGAGFAAVLLGVGALIRFSPNKLASRIGDGFVFSVFAILFGVSLAFLMNAENYGLTIILALVASIVYIVYAILRFIIYLITIIKPAKSEDNDPDNDQKIQLIIKWKALLDKGVITKDEFETKRKAILEIGEEEPVVAE